MGQRAHLEYRIIPKGRRWSVEAAGQALGEYPTAHQAIRTVIADCRHVVDMGHEVTILQAAAGRRPVVVWRSGDAEPAAPAEPAGEAPAAAD